MPLTPQSVAPNMAPADAELVTVVCTDENGHVHNHYIRDAALKTRLLTRHGEVSAIAAADRAAVDASLARARAAIDAPVLERAAAEIAAAALDASPDPV